MDEVLDWLQHTYTGSIGYEYEHLEDPESREWLREQIESGAHCQPLGAEEQKRLLGRLTEVEALEQFLHRAYLGAKRFSIEGTDMMVPMLDLAIERAAAAGAARSPSAWRTAAGSTCSRTCSACRTPTSSRSSRASTRRPPAPAT
jgi:2-oxoglutarate dehydrogenase complex dehydrogenase (E1) component-like enzyme